jgi:molybdopterin-guanine dinucleotide biosynthesis protein A
MPQSEISNPKSQISAALGGIVLAGGHSTRMGLAKATLPFGPELMLQRVVRLLSTVAHPIVVVAAANQELPPLTPDILIARDRRESRGPLEGLLAGLSALASTGAIAAYATSCDVPLLAPRFVSAMFDALGDYDIAVPIDGQFTHPLAAVYRHSVLPEIEKLLAADQLRPAYLFDRVRTKKVLVDDLRDADPDLSTLKNLNHAADYLSALQSAGFQPEPAILTALDRPHIG